MSDNKIVNELKNRTHKITSFKMKWLVLIFIIVSTTYLIFWLFTRAAISDMRHSLNYQDKSKDTLHQVVMSCNSKQLWLDTYKKDYLRSDLAKSNYVYRYVALDAEVLNYKDCLQLILGNVGKLNYKVQIAIFRNNEQILTIENFNKKEN